MSIHRSVEFYEDSHGMPKVIKNLFDEQNLWTTKCFFQLQMMKKKREVRPKTMCITERFVLLHLIPHTHTHTKNNLWTRHFSSTKTKLRKFSSLSTFFILWLVLQFIFAVNVNERLWRDGENSKRKKHKPKIDDVDKFMGNFITTKYSNAVFFV